MAKILIIDDEPSIREVMKAILKRHSVAHEVTVAEDGDKARLLLEKEPFDLVFSDFNMPGCPVQELFELVQDLCPSTIFVIMTGDGDRGVLWSYCHHFLRKPFKREDMMKLVMAVEMATNLTSEIP
jgi:two-component system response regulator PilR (NtrC family)